MMETDLVQVHHAFYREDIPFWLSLVEDRDPILEIGCGHGRVTLPLLESGRQVIGVDRDQRALDFLRHCLQDLAADAQNRAVLILDDILDYQPEGSFAAALIPCNTFSTFSPPARKALLEKSAALLKKGGILAASMPNPETLFEIQTELAGIGGETDPELESDFTHPDFGFPVQVSSRWRVEGVTIRWEWIYDLLFPDGTVERMVAFTDHYPASRDSLVAEIRAAGFSSVSCLGDFSGAPYRKESPYLVLTASR